MKVVFPPLFRAYWKPPNLFFFPHLAPLQYPLLCTYFLFMAFGVRYIQVTRSAEVGTDGLHATVQALTTFGTGGSFRLILLRTGGSLVLYTFCMLQQDLLLFPCAGGADPCPVRDPCQAREQANNPCQEFLGSLRDDPKASQPHASTARYASEPQLAGQLRRAVLASANRCAGCTG